jgi:hypothetical protein
MIRHVSSKITDLYWKESYSAIRRFYPLAPIMIVDDSSDRRFLREDIHLTHCTVIYDTKNKGRAEFLPYYYFHTLKPFSKAVILHDSVFLQAPLMCLFSRGGAEQEQTGIQFLWSIPHYHDDPIQKEIHELIDALPIKEREDVRSMYEHTKANWKGTFGVMSVVDWQWLDEVEQRYHLFENWFPVLKNREYRCALERVFGLVAYHHQPSRVKEPIFDSIQHYYVRWGTTFMEYLSKYEDYGAYPIIKVWSGR